MPPKEKLAEENGEEIAVRQQYAALCYRQNKKTKDIEVLLITSRDTGRWVTPKGWPMSKKAPHRVAEQEAYEEAGIKGKIAEKPLGNFHYLKRLDDGSSVPCVVDLYPLSVSKMKSKFPESAERERRWTSLAEAVEMVEEAGLKSLLMDFAARISE